MAAAAAAAAATALRVGALVVLCAVLAAAWPAHSKDAGSAATAAAEAAAAAGEECVSGHRKANTQADCGGSCYCLGGQWVCPENECGGGEDAAVKKLRSDAPEPLPLRRSKRVPLDGERCAPGVTYMDECNTCICSQDGIKAHASCTFKICPK